MCQIAWELAVDEAVDSKELFESLVSGCAFIYMNSHTSV